MEQLRSICVIFVLTSVCALPSPPSEHNVGSDAGLYNTNMFEGDILLPPTASKNGIRDDALLWPHGAVVYSIDSSVGCPHSWQCRMLMDAMDQYHKESCVRFQEWTGEPHRVHIFLNSESGACWSPVGRTGVTSQPLSLGSQCWYPGIVLHELMHAVGFWHEMTRPDRDSYINVFWPNIQVGFKSAFFKQSYSEVDTLGENFDYRSVMMYDEYAFSKDGVSETLKATQPGVVIGPIWKKTKFSSSDVRRLHALYSCQGNTPLPGFPYDMQCEFNDNTCGFKNVGAMSWSWQRVSSSEGFLYTTWEKSGARPGYLQSVSMHPTSYHAQLGCASFWYYLQSDDLTSNLTLMHAYLESVTDVEFQPETTFELWSSEHVANAWSYVQVPLYVTRPFKLLFESSFGAHTSQGVIVVDDVQLSYSACSGGPRAAPHTAPHVPVIVTLWDVPLN